MSMAADPRRPVVNDRGCVRADGVAKVAWWSRDKARAAARQMREGTREYRCSHCHQWHIGHPCSCGTCLAARS